MLKINSRGMLDLEGLHRLVEAEEIDCRRKHLRDLGRSSRARESPRGRRVVCEEFLYTAGLRG